MPQAGRQNTGKSVAVQISARGYVVDEDQDLALKDASTALMALALICDEAGDRFAELDGGDFAAIFRTFGRQIEQVRASAPYTLKCDARPRELH
ncbi:hypothetical protein H0274_01770 [Altererythrobacter sp. CC-YST694]|uniref:hypothetical protein n=1 Tax=Altererythrobacter sp. CC-YST694 TaxID=2755038 RepID=UPI001D00D99C|nr:hypothetical protein [Altererythrobacter sp. CC-YST694]MCB5423973.1 hypothetical protein [Altererythrobacter sp. CC-YST694]